MTAELSPCPFCGGRAATQAMSGYLAICCADCGATPDRKAYKEDEAAIAAWNRRVPALPATGEGVEPVAWRDMDSAPRDGRLILLAFGSDHVSTGSYHRNDDDPHPWKFIDTQGAGLPIFNGARDDKYGPTGWAEHPKWTGLSRPLPDAGDREDQGSSAAPIPTEGLPPPLFITSGPHLSGYRVVLGYETLTEAQDAHSALARAKAEA